MNLARTIRFDESDQKVFAWPAETGKLAIPGRFEFSNWAAGELVGKERQAFAAGWLGFDRFGHATFVAAAIMEQAERDALIKQLAAHLVTYCDARDIEAASDVATEEIAFMADVCEDHPPNTLLAVSRELTKAGVREAFRHIALQDAETDIVEFHRSVDQSFFRGSGIRTSRH